MPTGSQVAAYFITAATATAPARLTAHHELGAPPNAGLLPMLVIYVLTGCRRLMLALALRLA
jgi:hypothetical protein